MSAGPDWTLLVQDLLSPASANAVNPSTTPSLISYHLGTTPPSDNHKLATLISAVSTSPGLWPPTGPLPLELSQAVLGSFRNGMLYRLEQVSSESGSGWIGQRQLGKWLAAVVQSVESTGRAEVRLVLLSGLLVGLQQLKQSRNKFRVDGQSLTGVVEDAVVNAWADYLASRGSSCAAKAFRCVVADPLSLPRRRGSSA